ncbi:phosphoesterase PA-phosphatase [Micromonospora sp. CPCC 206060]|uniref:phosphoesterase PA-phosphatase n=1 Tax=Micromonospora sp. CPCC 206060 TaxID=3122406 RepID=UPI002FF34CEE
MTGRGDDTGPALRLARLVTEFTAPAVLATLLLVVIGWHSTPGGTGLAWGLFAALFASVIPFAYIVGGVRRGRLTDHHVGVREQRRLPLLVGLASVLAGLLALTLLGAPGPVRALVTAGAVGLLVGAVLGPRWKMSVHVAVATGAAAVLVLVFGPGLLLSLPLPVLVGWSRVRLGDHTVGQVVVGGIVGGAVTGLVFGLGR